MIVDLRLAGRLVVVVGGGREGDRKVRALLGEGCRITVFSESATPGIHRLAERGLVTLESGSVRDGFLDGLDPYMVMAATDDRALNRKIVGQARALGCVCYAADDPEAGDFAHPSTFMLRGGVRVAVSTGGQSPAMAMRISARAKSALADLVTDEDVGQISLQKEAREAARRALPDQADRRRFLHSVIQDETVKRLLAAGNIDEARARMRDMLGEYDGHT